MHFDTPRLPAFLQEMTLHNLSVCGGRVSVHLSRVGGEVAINVLERDGTIRVQTTS